MGVQEQVVKIMDATGTGKASVTSRGSKGAVAVELVDPSGNQIAIQSGLITQAYDYVLLSNYDAGGNVGTIVFKSGGAAGTIVGTLTLTYDASGNLLTVTKT